MANKLDVQKMAEDKKITKELEPGGNSPLTQKPSFSQSN